MDISQLIVFYKKTGETPLQALNRLRFEQPKMVNAILSYAGRLDPLAEGEMLVLVDDACKERQKYLGLDKTYVVDVLFGISTDTGDLLGKIKHVFLPKEIDIDEFSKSIDIYTSTLIGKRLQSYPTYSSKNIKKILKGETPEETQNTIDIYTIDIMHIKSLHHDTLYKKIISDIDSVVGEFRQKEILEEWKSFFDKNEQKIFTTVRMKVYCSAGTYMRVLAEELGLRLGLPALALHIKRETIHLK